MDTRRVKIEIAILKFYQLFHAVLLFLIILCHIICVNKYLLIFNYLIIIFSIAIFIYCLNCLFLLISSLLMFTRKVTPTLFNRFKNIALKIIFLSLIKGFLLTIIFWINYYHFPKFIENCPFNFSLNSIFKLMQKSNKETMSKDCSLRRCIYLFSDSESNNNNYLCNFNAEFDYVYNPNKNIICNYESIYNYHETKLFSYMENCFVYSNFYKCYTQEKKHDNYYVKYNQKCPYIFKKKRYIILGILFLFIDLFADIIIWLFIYSQYKRIFICINYEQFGILNLMNRLSPSSLNSTKDTSIVQKNNNNRDVITQININQTKTIFYPPIDKNIEEKKIDLKSSINSKNELISEN